MGQRAGCVPRLVLARDDQRRLVGAVPLYLKTNSYGEFIFDWSWANAAHRAGLRYYPKLVAGIPFTPVTGRRLPIAPLPDEQNRAVTAALLRGVRLVAEDERVSSIHFLFCTEAEKRILAGDRYLARLSMQFHWHNRHLDDPSRPPFESFEDFLGTFRSRNRKQVRKEREVVAAHRLTIRTATGPELEARDWKALRELYLANVARHHGTAYLTEAFFEIARATLGPRLVATLAYRGTTPIAGTINFEKGPHLYGRYWGAFEELPMLHFELCYYRLIERAIERQQTLFEAGAQGEHKLKRGLAPAYTHSAHWIRHPALAEAIAEYVRSEEEAVAEQVRLYAEHAPFHAGG